MRQQFLSFIVGFLLVSIAMSSCLGSDDTYDVSTDPTVHAFGLDTIQGVSYRFSIDQLNRLIYNIDSLPVGSDTIIDSILIDTFFVTGYVTSGDLDTILNTNNHQDLRGATSGDGLRFRIHAGDMTTYRDYHLKINIHQQDPDSLQWAEPFALPVGTTTGKEVKAVVCGNRLLVYVGDSTDGSLTAYATSVPSMTAWETLNLSGLPGDVDVNSLQEVVGSLYVLTASGDVYSSADGEVWTLEAALSGVVEALVAHYQGTLIGIVTTDGVSHMAYAASDGSGWEVDEEVLPEDFPRSHFYSTSFQTANLLTQIMVVGATTGEQIIPWAYDGNSWAAMNPETSYDTYCLTDEVGNHPAIIHYGGQFYILGERMDAFHVSVAGLAWSKVEEKVMLPENIVAGGSYALAADGDHYLYLLAGASGGDAFNVWRGRLNRLGFAIQ